MVAVLKDAAIPDGGGDMNVEVADGVAATDAAVVDVFNEDSIGVLAGVLPMKVWGDENVLVLFDPLIGAVGMVNDTDDAGCCCGC